MDLERVRAGRDVGVDHVDGVRRRQAVALHDDVALGVEQRQRRGGAHRLGRRHQVLARGHNDLIGDGAPWAWGSGTDSTVNMVEELTLEKLEPPIARPLTVTSEPTVNGSASPVPWPTMAINGVPAKPGCVVPSMTTGLVIAGRGEAGAIVWTPVPGMAKSIVFVPPVAVLESRIAWRSEPGPLSAVVVTTKRPS